MTIGEICNRNVVRATRGTTVVEAANLGAITTSVTWLSSTKPTNSASRWASLPIATS